MNLFKTSAAIVTAIEDIRTTGKKLDSMIHVAACSVIDHLEEHGDVTLMNNLVDAMPKGSRVNALRDFLNTFGRVSYDETKKAFAYDKTKETDLAGAMAISWTEFKPEQPFVPFDLQGMIKGVLNKAIKAQGDESQKDNVDAELLASLQALVAEPELEPEH